MLESSYCALICIDNLLINSYCKTLQKILRILLLIYLIFRSFISILVCDSFTCIFHLKNQKITIMRHETYDNIKIYLEGRCFILKYSQVSCSKAMNSHSQNFKAFSAFVFEPGQKSKVNSTASASAKSREDRHS